jgi:hypothetical protein
LRFQSWIQTHHSLSYDWVTEYIYIYIYSPNNTRRSSLTNLKLFNLNILNQPNQFLLYLFSFRPCNRLNWYL